MSPAIRQRLPKGIATQWRIVRALILRDMMMRYGRDNIGFVWVILEPMILTVGVMVVWSYTVGTNRQGLKLIEIILTGYMPLTLWRHMTSGPISIFRRSAAMLHHRSISLYDILWGRQALEFIATSAALLVVWGFLYTAAIVAPIERLDLLLLGWFMMTWLAGACGAIIAAVTEVSETAERFIQPIQYLTLPVSGAFFMVDWLPSWGQQAALWNPMVHCYEAFRAGYFGPAVTTHFNFWYLAGWAFVLTFVGVLAVQNTRHRVQLN